MTHSGGSPKLAVPALSLSSYKGICFAIPRRLEKERAAWTCAICEAVSASPSVERRATVIVPILRKGRGKRPLCSVLLSHTFESVTRPDKEFLKAQLVL